MAIDRQQTLQSLLDGYIVAILRADSADGMVNVVGALVDEGITCVELTLTTRGALEGIAAIRDAFGGRVTLGVGSVIEPQQVIPAADAGATFVVSPTFDPAVVRASIDADLVSCPGAYSPTEVLAAARAGADIVKVFPANGLGPGYLKDLLAPLPFLKLMPTGGVTPETLGRWHAAGAVAVGAGTSLVARDAAERNDLSDVRARARAFVAAREAARRAAG